MLKFTNYDIVFQEVPGEVTLAINLSNCPHRCKGCHSPYLREDKGEELSRETLKKLLGKYGEAISCVCFMGGDADPREIENLAAWLHRETGKRIKTGWYSGRTALPDGCGVSHFDYIKLGPYIAERGGLDSPCTNQRFYRVEGGEMIDITGRFPRVSPCGPR